jgi:hypothetical protein
MDTNCLSTDQADNIPKLFGQRFGEFANPEICQSFDFNNRRQNLVGFFRLVNLQRFIGVSFDNQNSWIDKRRGANP